MPLYDTNRGNALLNSTNERFQVNNLQVKACSANEKIIFDEC
ncbi:hypothetical protein T10_667 [Trichinella papuae]|uniref:Uncharacterized protein n=1 Tax=Trichinella papuae TaxID=268474 RepID=A0A0V1LZ76_9BILA|nr:hypothetical protein T10_667 [Trichinella papuae]